MASLAAAYSAAASNTGTIRVIKPHDFSQTSVQNYDSFSLIYGDGDNNHKKVYNLMKADKNKLILGYRVAKSIQDAVAEAKKTNAKMVNAFEYSSSTIIIGKTFDRNELVTNEIITPSRFNGILAMAAHDMYIEKLRKSTKEFMKFIKDCYENLTNPFAMSHGFYPSSEPQEVTDDSTKLMLYYMITTVGFDFVSQIAPVEAVAIGVYRSHKLNPFKLGLTNGLDVTEADLEKSGVKCNVELSQRCVQGLYTKMAKWGQRRVKVEELIKDPEFKERVKVEAKFLISTCQPSKAKESRVLKFSGLIEEISREVQHDTIPKSGTNATITDLLEEKRLVVK